MYVRIAHRGADPAGEHKDGVVSKTRFPKIAIDVACMGYDSPSYVCGV